MPDLLRSRKRHQQILLLHVTPTGEDSENRKDEEEMAPLNVEIVEIERLHEIHREESQDKKVEQDPWYQESTLPFSHSMTGETR